MSKEINFEDLSPAQQEMLMQKALDLKAAKDQKVKDNRATYKKMVNETVPALFHELLGVSITLSEMKTKVFADLQTLIEMKAEVFGKADNKYSHSFTTECGITIMIGHRYNDGWDDTVTAGISKVTAFMESLGKDKNSKMLVKTIMQLLSKDDKGNLKSSRVLQLKKLAEETGDPEFLDGINIIQQSYNPVKTKEFITVKYKGNNGETMELPLDITTAEPDFEMPLAYAQKPKDQETTEA